MAFILPLELHPIFARSDWNDFWALHAQVARYSGLSVDESVAFSSHLSYQRTSGWLGGLRLQEIIPLGHPSFSRLGPKLIRFRVPEPGGVPPCGFLVASVFSGIRVLALSSVPLLGFLVPCSS